MQSLGRNPCSLETLANLWLESCYLLLPLSSSIYRYIYIFFFFMFCLWEGEKWSFDGNGSAGTHWSTQTISRVLTTNEILDRERSPNTCATVWTPDCWLSEGCRSINGPPCIVFKWLSTVPGSTTAPWSPGSCLDPPHLLTRSKLSRCYRLSELHLKQKARV